MVTKKKARTATKKTVTASRKPDPARVMRDLHAVLDRHGLNGRIDSLTFASQAPCVCPNGSPGVWRVINGQLVCVCT